jgi:hypothetical protein
VQPAYSDKASIEHGSLSAKPPFEAVQEGSELTFKRGSMVTPRAATQEDEAEDMRAQLTALGVKVDGRWSVPRLRQELDDATAPKR